MSAALAGQSAGAPPPLVSIDLAATIERLGEAWPAPLVRTIDIERALGLARTLPPIFHWLMLETRLTPHDERVDVLAAIIDQGCRPAGLESWPSLDAPLVSAWAGRCDPRLDGARVLWLEWDAPFAQAPLQIAALDPRFWGRPGSPRPSVAGQVEVYDAIHRASFGRAHDERVLGQMRAVIAALPASAMALFGASLAPRGHACDRLFVALPRASVIGWLAAIDWPGDPTHASHWLERAVPPWELAYLQIEVMADGLTPYLAIESRQTSRSRSERRARAAFLGDLVEHARVPAGRARAALDWDGEHHVGDRVETRSIHIKCALREAEPVEIKAYLGVHYRASVPFP